MASGGPTSFSANTSCIIIFSDKTLSLAFSNFHFSPRYNIRTRCKTFGGTLDDAECMKLTGLARNTYYKYKRQIRAELMAEQDLPKGASIFYEPSKSF